MKKIIILLTVLLFAVMFSTCTVDDPLTGKTTLAIIGNDMLFPMAFDQYKEVLNDAKSNGKEITIGKDYEMVKRLGDKISASAEKWYESITGDPNYLYKQGYRWEYHLIEDKQVNAWCLPGGKIVVYTGILPVTENEDALAVVMGHEVSHALLNHGQQRVSTNLLMQAGLTVAQLGAALTIKDQQTQAIFLGALGLGANLGVILPFSRDNESEADHYGLILMAIAGYDPDKAGPFWDKMAQLGSKDPLFDDILSTHPSSDKRAKAMSDLAPEAKKRAAKLRIDDLKASIPQAKRIAAEINGQ
jgi:predicted Zn-dependent protease